MLVELLDIWNRSRLSSLSSSLSTDNLHCVSAKSVSVVRAQNYFMIRRGETDFASDCKPNKTLPSFGA